MTTREATSLLTRVGSTPVIGAAGRSIADWAAMLAFGAIQWPWLVRSLHGGRLADKHALLDRLNLPYDALPYLGSWKADTGLLDPGHRPYFRAPAEARRRIRHRRLHPDPRPSAATGRAAAG